VLCVQSAVTRCCISLRRMVLKTRSGLVFDYKQVLLESFKPSLLSNHHLCHLLCEVTGARRIELESQCHRWRIARLFGASHSMDETQTKHAGYAKGLATRKYPLAPHCSDPSSCHGAISTHQPTSTSSQSKTSRPLVRRMSLSQIALWGCGAAQPRSAAARGARLDPMGSHPGAKPRG
jgi:hypothetical protein